MAEIQRLMVDGQLPPVSHYCHVVRAGNLVWVSGSVGARPDGTVPADAGEQMEVALANIDACLRAAGAGPEHVVKVNVYLTDINDRAKVNPPRQRYFGEHRPASTLVGVTALVLPALKVEVEVTAVVASEAGAGEPPGQIVTF
ncbi:RidA family protein [Rhodopila sp.]|jgi:enamine deaminase RidA (YjgF/YER057c/UK114 family)|uniref:RidA family protein n=1 Tax=Rhodopila sp. TaxID=2480087 RepID=UPI002C68A7DE|nr:RidA family protein [Rhodopila sp.]HVZ07990.1 RidA family protein [Rhodopila sp.]